MFRRVSSPLRPLKPLKPLKPLLAAALILSLPAAAGAADTYKIDPDHVHAGFKIMHLGYSHLHGRFNKVAGSFAFDGKSADGAVVKVTIDTASLDTNHEKRDAHLKSPDFFNVLEFPEMTFTSTAVEPTGDRTAKVTGDLTLLGVTRPVTLAVTFNKASVHPFDGKKPADQQRFLAGFTATGTLKRSEFGMKYGIPAIADEVALEIDVEGIRE